MAPCAAASPAHTRPPLLPITSYDWSQLTTVAWNEDPALLCAAHAAGARVVLGGRFQPSTVLHSAEHRTAWVAAQLGKALRLHLDGINFDLVGAAPDLAWWVLRSGSSAVWARNKCKRGVRWLPPLRLLVAGAHGRRASVAVSFAASAALQEEPIPPGDPLAQNYTALVAEAAATFHAAIPGSQVCAGWSPAPTPGLALSGLLRPWRHAVARLRMRDHSRWAHPCKPQRRPPRHCCH